MSTVTAIINAGTHGAQAALAAAALRKAGQTLGHQFNVEIRNPDGVSGAVDAAAVAASDVVLLIGGADPADPRLSGKRTVALDFAAVLADPQAVLAKALNAPAAAAAGKKIVGVTSCPTGIAHTFMAAEGLVQGAKQLGYTARIETQGSVGAQDTLSPEEIAAADLVIIAADTNVDMSRFAGKRLYSTGTKDAIGDGKGLVAKAFADAAVYRPAGLTGGRDLAAEVAAEKAARAASRTGAYKHLMTGVSYMLPFVVAGGLLIAIAFALGGIYVYDDAHKGTIGQALFLLGAKGGFALMVPILAGYIAYSIADRPGIAPGAIGGMMAVNIGAGFIGGIVAGFIAGYVVAFLNRHIRLPRNLEGLKPVLILPLLGAAITGLLMLMVIGQPVAQLLAALTEWLKGMQGANAMVLGALIGAMMAFDMGGPINKSAYTFATGLLASHVDAPMAAAMVAGMTPPLGLALATKLFRDRFTPDEREAGNAAAVLGISFITEGAIPFAARDPFRVIPSLMIGSAVAGAVSMLAGCELHVPHGGVFVLFIPNAVTQLPLYLVAMVAGTLVTTLCLRVVKPNLEAEPALSKA